MTSYFRDMSAADLAAIFAIEQVSHPSPWPMRGLEESLAAHKGIVLCDENERLLGYAFVQKIVDEAHLLDIAIAPSERGKGYGRLLMLHLMESVMTTGISLWFLEVRASNTGAIGLYTSLGFNEMGLRRNYYRDAQGSEDAVLMAYTV